MRVLIAAIGKAKSGPEIHLYQDYIKRLPWKVTCSEHVAKISSSSQRIQKESQLLLDSTKGYDKIISLDESGKLLSSREFAKQIANWQQQGASSMALMIGGSDGLSTEALKQSDLVWSLGKVTWPHMLVRALLAEQLYRAHSIISNHPYHREG